MVEWHRFYRLDVRLVTQPTNRVKVPTDSNQWTRLILSSSMTRFITEGLLFPLCLISDASTKMASKNMDCQDGQHIMGCVAASHISLHILCLTSLRH